MAQITAQMVKDLREMTGAGMMDCKAALGEASGNIEAAVDWLRKKGLSKAAKKADRVARNDLFQGLVKMIASVALDVGPDVEKLKAAKAGSTTIAVSIAETVAKIGENMTLRRAAELKVGKGAVGSYIHNVVTDGLGKMGVLVGLESTGNADELAALGRQLAMHVASANPLAVEPSGLDPAVVKREKDVLADKFKAQGKPANMIEKIVESGIKTFYKEVCLLEQPFIFDDKKNVAQALKEGEGKAGGPIKVTGFVRYALGEGIEKQETDFAAEVAAAAG